MGVCLFVYIAVFSSYNTLQMNAVDFLFRGATLTTRGYLQKLHVTTWHLSSVEDKSSNTG